MFIAADVSAMVELNCETDFVARTDESGELAHNIAMQVAAMNPKYISEENYSCRCAAGEEMNWTLTASAF